MKLNLWPGVSCLVCLTVKESTPGVWLPDKVRLKGVLLDFLQAC